jgi:hypothetical protein
MSGMSRKTDSESSFLGYIALLVIAVIIVIAGYMSNSNPIPFIAAGLIALYFAKVSLRKSLRASQDMSVFDQTFENSTIVISIAYEIPPEADRPSLRTRVQNAVRESLDNYLSESGSTGREDLRAVIHGAACDIVSEYGGREFTVRIPSIRCKATKPTSGIKIGHERVS